MRRGPGRGRCTDADLASAMPAATAERFKVLAKAACPAFGRWGTLGQREVGRSSLVFEAVRDLGKHHRPGLKILLERRSGGGKVQVA